MSYIIKYRGNKKKPKYITLCVEAGGIEVKSTLDPKKATRFTAGQVPIFSHPGFSYELVEVEE
jgi:hypothetical protein